VRAPAVHNSFNNNKPPPLPAGGAISIPWGARWTPPRSQVPPSAIKRAHPTRLGRPLGPFSTPPRATPRLGGVGCVRVVPGVSTSLAPLYFVLALRELGLRLGVKAPLPLRASSRGVLPGLVISPVSALRKPAVTRGLPFRAMAPNGGGIISYQVNALRLLRQSRWPFVRTIS
jgi:hypothetical protein